MILGIIGWLIAGLLVGFIASKVVNLRGDDPLGGIAIAVAGAIAGALIYTVISGAGVTPWNRWSIFYAAIGALIGVTLWHTVRSRYSYRGSQTIRRSY